MTDLIIEKKNESYIYLLGEQSTLQELSDIFTFYAEGYKFHPSYKAKHWDGRIKLLKYISRTRAELYFGLLDQVIAFCENRGYTYEIKGSINQSIKLDKKEIESFISDLKLTSKGESIEPRDYQYKGFLDAISRKRLLLLSPTSSGKSLIIYLICRYLIDSGKKGLILVPNISLVHQLYSDFEDYANAIEWNVGDYCHKIYQGQDKVSEKQICISTWQSLHTIRDKSFFEQFDFVLTDECFSGDTKILTKQGYIEIKNIIPGDVVINYDENKKIFKEDVVEKLHKNISKNEKMYLLEFDNGKNLKVTGNHKFLTTEGWVRADNLNETHEIISYE